MRKPMISLLVVLTVVFAAFILGFLLGRNQHHDTITVSLPQRMLTEPTQMQMIETTVPMATEGITFPIDINLATEDALMALPGIGEVLARRILAYRDQNGSFSTVEELLNVDGIGKKRLEEIWDLITIGGKS